jgi:hypothetical protein
MSDESRGKQEPAKKSKRGASPERMRELTRAREAKRRARSEAAGPSAPPIEVFVTDRQYLGLTPSAYQLTLLKAFYGRPLVSAEVEIWEGCTGGREYPEQPFSELTLVSGARSGKNSYIETPILLYESIFGGFVPNPGETVAVVLVAQDARAAQLSHRLAREYLRRSPLLSKYLAGETKDRLTLSNGIEFRTYPCTSKSIYGYSIVAGGMDEVARFPFEGAADSDEDVQAAILRGMAHYGGRSKLVKVSSPSSRAGLLYTDFQRSFGKPDRYRLVWQSTSEKMAPGIVDAAFIQRMREADPLRAARLFDAEFAEDVNVFLTAEAIEAATDYRVRERFPEPGAEYIFALDAAGHGEDAFTLAGVRCEGKTAAELKVEQVFGKAWEKPRSGVRNLEITAQEAAEIVRRYGVGKVYGDRVTGGWVQEAFERQGVRYVYPTIKRDGKDVYVTRSMGYLEAAPLLRAGRLRILDDEPTRRELRNLEQRGDRVDHPAGGSDDRANAVMLAAAMAVQTIVKPGFPPLAWAIRTEIGPDGRRVTMVSSEPERGHDLDSNSHRAECRACRAKWMARENRPEPGADGMHQVPTPSGRLETYFDPRGLEAPVGHHDVCGTCGVRLGAPSEAELVNRKRQHVRDSPRCLHAEEKLRRETGLAHAPQNVVTADPSPLTAPAKGTVSFDVVCQCCGRECCGPTTPASSMAEAEAVQATHLAESRRCADWAAERGTRETFKVRSRKTR